jgi:hypothetical protein
MVCSVRPVTRTLFSPYDERIESEDNVSSSLTNAAAASEKVGRPVLDVDRLQAPGNRHM